MKKNCVFFGIVFAAALLPGCPTDGGSGGGSQQVVNPPAPEPGASEMVLTGGVYTQDGFVDKASFETRLVHSTGFEHVLCVYFDPVPAGLMPPRL